MDKKLYEAHASFLAKFVYKAKKRETGAFRMTYELSSAYNYHFQFMKVPVGSEGCCYIYGCCDKAETALDQLDLPVKVYAIVTKDAVFFTLYASQFGLSYWTDEEWTQFSQMIGCTAYYFPDWCKQFREDFAANVIAPFYDSLEDLPELSENDKDECRYDAQTQLVYGSCESLKEFNYPPVSREIIAQLLCSLDEPFRAYKEHCTISLAGRMRKHKALRNHTLSLIESNSVFEPWELDMAGALRDLTPDSRLMVTFSYEGKDASGRMKTTDVRSALSKRSIFFNTSFFNHNEGHEIIRTLTGFRDHLAPKHIVKIAHGNKVLYEKVV